ncbi:MAG: methyltransferase domain-containing protein [bacterium]|nr:methyltransferase domain-containing protein [bacterium]
MGVKKKKSMSKNSNQTSSRHPLESVYGEGYFHGENSGYSKEGYTKDRPDRSKLIAWAKEFKDGGARWLDIGCAYGYQVNEAIKAGFDAVGLDVSSYALSNRNGSEGAWMQGVAGNLPVQNASVDVISAFDLVEHLHSPDEFFDEIDRVLKPDGWAIIATPDPIYFHRPEPTHVYERPASYWMNELKKRGFTGALRFGARPYEIEILAARDPGGDWERIQREFEEQNQPNAAFVQFNGDLYSAHPRGCGAQGRWIDGDMVYWLNQSEQPQQVRVIFETEKENHPDLFLGDLKLHYDQCETNGETRIHRWKTVTLPPGGRDLSIRVEKPQGIAGRFVFSADSLAREDFVLELSFDHYQRYQFISQILSAAAPNAESVLDVGGAYGYLSLFHPQTRIEHIDRTWEDSPTARAYSSDRLPYPDQSFDVVVSVDTLEHVPLSERQRFIDEICRVARLGVVICGPFEDAGVEEAEGVLREFAETQLQRRDRFLSEHAEYTLPNLQSVGEIFDRNGFDITGLPNGYLPRWLAMQFVQFIMCQAPELTDGKARLNALYNTHYYALDNREPAYRIAVIAWRHPLDDHAKRTLTSLISQDRSSPAEMWNIASLTASLSQFRLIREKEEYLRRRAELEGRLHDHIHNLEESLKEAGKRNESLMRHADNLQGMVDEGRKLNQEKDKLLAAKESEFPDRLKQHESALKDHQAALEKHIGNLEKINDESLKHTKNLEGLLKEKDARSVEQEKHTANLVAALNEREKHAANLVAALNEREKHADNLVTALTEQQKHAANLEVMLKERDRTINELNKRIQALENRISILIESASTESPKPLKPAKGPARQDGDEGAMKQMSRVEELFRALETSLADLCALMQLEPQTGMPLTVQTIQNQIQNLMAERERDREMIHRARTSFGYRMMRKTGLTPSLDDPPSE